MKIIKAELHHAAMLSVFAAKTFYDAWKEFNTEEDMQHFICNHFTQEIILREIADKDQPFFLAFDDEILYGYLKLKKGNPANDSIAGQNFEIEKLYVENSFQNKQTGSRLLKRAEEECAGKKANNIWLSVWKPNTRAIKFYERNGFSIFGEQVFLH